VALGDLDGDGDLDAVFANQGIYDSRVLLNDGTGRFEYTDQRLTRQGHGVDVGDLDGDGDLDLFITCAHYSNRGLPSRVYFNDGTGAFTESDQDLGDVDISGNLVQLVDIDGDLDAFVAYLTVPRMDLVSRIYLNDGLGSFTLSELELPFGTLFADLDDDGDADAFVKVSGEGYRVFANDGAGGFDRESTDLSEIRAAWPILADFDGDGALDLFLSLVADEDRLWLGDGTGRFVDSGVRLGGNGSRRVAAGYLNGGGDFDLFVPVYGMCGGPNRVWENVSGS